VLPRAYVIRPFHSHVKRQFDVELTAMYGCMLEIFKIYNLQKELADANDVTQPKLNYYQNTKNYSRRLR
jgi:hypothetical protein